MQVNGLPITATRVASATRNDKWLSRVAEFTRSRWPQGELDNELKLYHRIRDEITLEEDCLLRGVRVIIPENYREEILTELHANHPGMVRMKALARLHVWWPNIDSDIENKVAKCESCTKQLPNFPKAQANPWIWPQTPWQRIHVDFAGPFRNEMFLVVVDAHSKWLEIVRMSSTSAASTINALRHMFSSYGLPKEVVSDNGPQFVAEEFEIFLKRNGIAHIKSAPYHPSSNGEAERAVRTFKQAMKTMELEGGTLNQKLAAFLLSYRTTPHSMTKTTPSELFLGRKVRTRLDMCRPALAQSVLQRSMPKEKTPRTFEVGDIVVVRDYRGNPKKPSWIRAVVLKKLGPVTYTVQVNNMQWKRHIDQIRSCDPSCKVSRDREQTPEVFNSPIITIPTAKPNGISEIQPVEPSTTISSAIHEEPKDPQSYSPMANVDIEPRYPSRERRKPCRLIDNQCLKVYLR